MRKAAAKLRSNSGVTIVMALFFLLVAAMVSVISLSAAQTAAKNASKEEAIQQAYLSVSSAAQFIEQRMTEGELVVNNVGKTKLVEENVLKAQSPFFPLLKRAVYAIANGSTSFEESFYLTGDDPKCDSVSVRFVMDEDYDISIFLGLPEGSEPNYYMTLTLVSDPKTKLLNTYYTWGDACFEKGWN